MSSYLEAIAALGGGSLHPGGFSHTLDTLGLLRISGEDVVLDIGCGTGRTACHLVKSTGAHVFAVDKSPVMLAKARARAAQEGAGVHFVLGDALDLPFRDGVADLVFLESVLVFLPVENVLKECRRVLKTGGILAAIEFLACPSLPAGAAEEIKALCGLPQIPTLQEWNEYFDRSRFARILVKQDRFPGLLANLRELLYPDPYRIVSKEVETDGELNKLILRYKGLIIRNRRHLGFGTFIVKKE